MKNTHNIEYVKHNEDPKGEHDCVKTKLTIVILLIYLWPGDGSFFFVRDMMDVIS